jgi:GntR family transcriptional regulator/MocR family aminotransferase
MWSRPIERRSPPPAELHVSLVGRKDLSGEIYRQLRRAILDGHLRPGERMPPTRELAQRLSVSRTTVEVAYDRLWSEGFVSARVGAGTFVAEHAEAPPRGAQRRATTDALRPRPIWRSIPLPTAFERTAAFDFRSGLPDVSLFPFATWRRLIARQLRPEAVGPGVYADPSGHPGLREAIARHVSVSRGVEAAPEDVVVTNGTQQALDLVARALLAPGDVVAVEDPGYEPTWQLLRSLGLRARGVPVDREGLAVERLPPNARLVYVTPSHQYPLGMTMALGRRLALLDWARRHGAAVVEDDYDSEFRFGGRPIEPLQTLDVDGLVVYVGSFSKTLLPTLRLGFVVTPRSLRHAVQAAKYTTDWHTPLPAQAALADFIDSGAFARHLRRAGLTYRARHHLVTQVLTRDFADHLEVVPSVAGLHVSALARTASVEQVEATARRAADVGVEVQRLASFALEAPARPGLVLGYGAIAAARIEEGLRRLRDCFER